MDAAKILEQWLKQNGYDGLYNSEMQCACEVDDLIPCDWGCSQKCQPGYRRTDDPGEVDWGWYRGDWWIGSTKQG